MLNMDFSRQIKLVGIAQIFYAGMRLVANLIFTVVFNSLATSDPSAFSPLFVLGLLASLPALAAGIGLLMKRPWGRMAAVAAGAIELVMIPMGTILGLLTLWLMARKEVAALVADWGDKEQTIDDLLAKMPEPGELGDADHHMK
jgi:putative Mn2+ efflux pump MntP